MTKEETMERIKLMQDQLKAMQAYVDGKDIELWNPTSKRWELEENPAWSLLWKYRIKPEPTYRPFRNAHECLEEMRKHTPFGWANHIGKNICYCIDAVSYTEVYIDKTWHCFDYMFRIFTFFDGSPFGVKVENEEE